MSIVVQGLASTTCPVTSATLLINVFHTSSSQDVCRREGKEAETQVTLRSLGRIQIYAHSALSAVAVDDATPPKKTNGKSDFRVLHLSRGYDNGIAASPEREYSTHQKYHKYGC